MKKEGSDHRTGLFKDDKGLSACGNAQAGIGAPTAQGCISAVHLAGVSLAL